jgi:multimeric flavodoxin WrbA
MNATDASAMGGAKFVLGISTSPRRTGNSALLAQAILEGAAEAGHRTEYVHLPDIVTGMLRNCRECRRPDGSCSIDDGYRDLFLNKVLPADALVFATPIWWYGMSAGLKNYFDRMFCYYALSYPDHEDVQRRMVRKRVALALSAEENNFSARLGIMQQMQELCRYMYYDMVGVVTGIGNKTGETVNDPTHPIAEARQLGRRLFEIEQTDYKLDTVRAPRIWSEDNKSFPSYWR